LTRLLWGQGYGAAPPSQPAPPEALPKSSPEDVIFRHNGTCRSGNEWRKLEPTAGQVSSSQPARVLQDPEVACRTTLKSDSVLSIGSKCCGTSASTLETCYHSWAPQLKNWNICAPRIIGPPNEDESNLCTRAEAQPYLRVPTENQFISHPPILPLLHYCAEGYLSDRHNALWIYVLP
jgi:hypothetical protein